MEEQVFLEEMRAAGHRVSQWSNGPGDTYARHAHPYTKILCCLEGSIVFHLAHHDERLGPGDRLVVDAGVEHSATVGASGVRCVEAHAK